MRNALVTFALLVSMSGHALADATERDREDDIAVLTEKKVHQWPKLYAERDADGLADFLAYEFKVLEPNGTVRTRDEEVAWLRTTPRDEEESDFLFTIEEIVFAGDDLAIVYGHGDSTRETEDGQPCHHNYWSSNTFLRKGGTWKPVFSHISGISCTPIE